MQTLQSLITLLERGRKLHISVLDLSGILDLPLTRLTFESTIHSKAFCSAAKISERGRRICFRCKALANSKAAEGGCAFMGYCSWGLYEYALPVKIGDTVAAVVYVGNAVIDEEKSRERLLRTARLGSLECEALLSELENAERIESSGELGEIAEIVADYLRLAAESSPKPKKETHWLVAAMKRYADEQYTENLTLHELGATYQKNEKYLGRLFKKEIGVSFSDYVLAKRLKRAEKLLKTTEEKIIEIALECGFNSISYFNRIFKNKNGVSPQAFRLS